MAIRTLTLGTLVAVLASLFGIVYVYFYYQLFDFSKYLPLWKIPAIFTFISFLLVGFSIVISMLFKKKGNVITSVILTLFSILSYLVVGRIKYKTIPMLVVPIRCLLIMKFYL